MRHHLRGARLVPCTPDGSPEHLDLLVTDDRIVGVQEPGQTPAPGARVHDLDGCWIMPGLVQTHIHLVQTLFAGLADDLPLLDWLSQRIWPLERAHDADSVYWSARLGITELLLGGTTAILDMATVHHTEEVFRAAEEAGIRAWVGKAMMDRDNVAGLGESTRESIDSSLALARHWHGRGRLRYAFAPRFVPSCSDELLQETARHARELGCLLHTHASENTDEVALVEQICGARNIVHLDRMGISGPDTVLAHCVHLDETEVALLASTRTTVAHCPGSNLKLASGICPVPRLLDAGVRVTLGADGAPCNNRLDAFREMHLAGTIQSPVHGADSVHARQVLDMATRAGAEALGLEAGQLAPGRLADFVVLRPSADHCLETVDPVGAIVYALSPASVEQVWIGGEPVVQGGVLGCWDHAETIAGATAALGRVRERVGL